MSYVLEAKRIPPSNTKITPIPLNAAELAKQITETSGTSGISGTGNKNSKVKQ